jgi:hypothetical protein
MMSLGKLSQVFTPFDLGAVGLRWSARLFLGKNTQIPTWRSAPHHM